MRFVDWLSVSSRVVILSCLFPTIASAAPEVWSGLTKSFTKDAFADPTLPENQDQISPSVALTRGNLMGMYNAVSETEYLHAVSPQDTAWATALVAGNEGQMIEAANWAALTFTNWETAYGSAGVLATNIVELPAVVHLTTDDIYLDLQFTEWGLGFSGGGSFSYLRSAVPEPTTLWLFAIGLLSLLARGGRVPRPSNS